MNVHQSLILIPEIWCLSLFGFSL